MASQQGGDWVPVGRWSGGSAARGDTKQENGTAVSWNELPEESQRNGEIRHSWNVGLMIFFPPPPPSMTSKIFIPTCRKSWSKGFLNILQGLSYPNLSSPFFVGIFACSTKITTFTSTSSHSFYFLLEIASWYHLPLRPGVSEIPPLPGKCISEIMELPPTYSSNLNKRPRHPFYPAFSNRIVGHDVKRVFVNITFKKICSNFTLPSSKGNFKF